MSQDSTDNSSQTPPADAAAKENVARPARFHWKTGLTILLVGVAVQAAAWFLQADDATMRVMSAYFILPTLAFVLLGWWLLGSGLSWRVRLTGVGIVGAAVGAFFLVFRFDGFTGDFVPTFSLRSSPSAKQEAEAFWKDRPVGPGVAAAAVISDDDPTAAAARLDIADDDWPQFRGPDGDGIVTGVRLRRDWDSNPPRLLWKKQPVGVGWSSFAVVGRHVFTQEQRGLHEVVVCYDFDSGEEIWTHADSLRYESVQGGDGPRATPTVFDSRVYALGGSGVLNCLDALTGERLWSTNILEDAGGVENTAWGMAGSPLAYDDLVVVNPGGDAKRGKNSGVIAYDRLTGEQVWAEGGYPASYTVPVLATLGGLRQVLVFDGHGLGGHDAQTGRQLWRSPKWSNAPQVNAARPIVLDGDRILISTGYGTGSALLAVQQQNGEWTCEPTGWEKSNHLKLKFNGGVLKDGHIYGLDEGILACLNVETGRRTWKAGRYGYGQLILVDDLLLILTEKGEVVLVEATPDAHHEVARFQAIEGKTWNHPVLVRGRLLVRNAEQAACYDLE